MYLDGIYFCPHVPEADCRCRKPRTGLVELAANEMHFDPRDCFVIGDKACDIEMGQQLGATTLLVRTGYGATVEAEANVNPDYVVNDLLEATETIEGLVRPRAGWTRKPGGANASLSCV